MPLCRISPTFFIVEIHYLIKTALIYQLLQCNKYARPHSILLRSEALMRSAGDPIARTHPKKEYQHE